MDTEVSGQTFRISSVPASPSFVNSKGCRREHAAAFFPLQFPQLVEQMKVNAISSAAIPALSGRVVFLQEDVRGQHLKFSSPTTSAQSLLPVRASSPGTSTGSHGSHAPSELGSRIHSVQSADEMKQLGHTVGTHVGVVDGVGEDVFDGDDVGEEVGVEVVEGIGDDVGDEVVDTVGVGVTDLGALTEDVGVGVADLVELLDGDGVGLPDLVGFCDGLGDALGGAGAGLHLFRAALVFDVTQIPQ